MLVLRISFFKTFSAQLSGIIDNRCLSRRWFYCFLFHHPPPKISAKSLCVLIFDWRGYDHQGPSRSKPQESKWNFSEKGVRKCFEISSPSVVEAPKTFAYLSLLVLERENTVSGKHHHCPMIGSQPVRMMGKSTSREKGASFGALSVAKNEWQFPSTPKFILDDASGS